MGCGRRRWRQQPGGNHECRAVLATTRKAASVLVLQSWFVNASTPAPCIATYRARERRFEQIFQFSDRDSILLRKTNLKGSMGNNKACINLSTFWGLLKVGGGISQMTDIDLILFNILFIEIDV
jgi:hypothetical protein